MCEIQDIVTFTKSMRKEWNEHIDQMSSIRFPKIASYEKPTGRRSPGRSSKIWAGCPHSSNILRDNQRKTATCLIEEVNSNQTKRFAGCRDEETKIVHRPEEKGQ